MPTGYTAPVQDGTVTDFAEFVWKCSRAFGALILMRDSPHDAPIPQQFEPSGYCKQSVVDAEAEVSRYEQMTLADARPAMDTENAEEAEYANRGAAEKRTTRERYERMLAQVESWEPPSPDHVGLRDFMIEQLRNSIMLWDCVEHAPDARPTDPAEWLRAKRIIAQRRLAYAQKSLADEIERTEGCNRWLRQLRESVPIPPHMAADQ